MTVPVALQIILLASKDNLPDPNDQKLAGVYTAPVLLKAKKSKVFTVTGNTAATLERGNYFLLAAIDAANGVAESNEGNNVAASEKSYVLAPSAVDLAGKFSKLPKTASASKVLTISLSVQNLGTILAAGTVDFDFYASTDTTLDGADVSLGTQFPFVIHVPAGKSQTARFKLSINPGLIGGSYYLVARVNSTSSLSESELTNNMAFSTTRISILS
jgi:hypothetical protein